MNGEKIADVFLRSLETVMRLEFNPEFSAVRRLKQDLRLGRLRDFHRRPERQDIALLRVDRIHVHRILIPQIVRGADHRVFRNLQHFGYDQFSGASAEKQKRRRQCHCTNKKFHCHHLYSQISAPHVGAAEHLHGLQDFQRPLQLNIAHPAGHGIGRRSGMRVHQNRNSGPPSRGQRHRNVRVDSLPVNDSAGRRIVFRGRNPQGFLAAERNQRLHDAFPERPFADHHRALVILQTSRHDLSRARRVHIDENRQWKIRIFHTFHRFVRFLLNAVPAFQRHNRHIRRQKKTA